MPPNTSPARQWFELATVRLRSLGRTTERSFLQLLRLPPPLEMVKEQLSWDQRVPPRLTEMILAMPLATRQLPQAKWHLKANLLVQAKQPVLEEKNLDFASQKAKQLMLLPVAPARPLDLFRPQVILQEQQLQLAKDSPVLRARARRYSRGLGPSAFSREAPAAQKCNRAAHCGGYPIRARYRHRRNLGVPARCGNRRSRLPRKRARRVRTFQTAAADRCRCLPRRIAD